MDDTSRNDVLSVEEHAISGPPLHTVEIVDRLCRLYAYALQWIDSFSTRRPLFGVRNAVVRPRMGRWIAHRAPYYPFIFWTWLEYPEVFEEVDNEALADFVARMPTGLGPSRMDAALRTILNIKYPGLHQQSLQPRSYWQILELPGSAGRYSSLMCQAYPELIEPNNCTVVCRSWHNTPDGVIERAAAGVYALLAGAGEGTKPRILDGLPDLKSEYDVIIGLRGTVKEADEKLQSMLTPNGKLLLLDDEPVEPYLSRVR